MRTQQSTRQGRSAGYATGARRGFGLRSALALAATFMLLGACAGAGGGSSSADTPSTMPAQTLVTTATPLSGGDAVVADFLALTQAPDRSVHLESAGVASFAGTEMRLTTAYDLFGDDYLGTSTVESPAFGTMTTGAASVGGQAYTGHDGTDWSGSSTPAPPQDPFRGLVPGDVEYAGPTDVDGAQGHLLRLRDPVGALTRAMGVTSPQVSAITPSSASFEVRVDAQGRPASAMLSLRGTAAGVGELEVGIEYAFRDWGAIPPIEPPADIPPTPDPAAALTVYNRITADILVRDGNGIELPVAACGMGSATAFDVSRFRVLLAASGEVIGATFPDSSSFVTRVVIVGADFFQTQPGAYLDELPPCQDRVTP